VAFAGFLFVSGFHNVLLLEPLTVLGLRGTRGSCCVFRAQIKVHGLLLAGFRGGTLTGVVLCGWLRTVR